MGKIIAVTVGSFAAMVLLAMINVSEDILALLITGLLFFWIGYGVWAVVKAVSSKGSMRTARKNAPAWYKAFVLAKPVLAFAAAALLIALFPSVDEYCYAGAIFGIVMIIWTAFDVVRTQNRFTMRDLPLFNEKRGGEA